MVARILSGGQTGADRGALDAALALGIPHGGWCPRGRRAEDGRIPDRYRLQEIGARAYAARTAANVRDADATILVTRGAPTGGSRLTADLARRYGRPLLHVDLDRHPDPAAAVAAFLAGREGAVINVAGPRESHCPGIAQATRAVLEGALGRDR